MSPFQHAQSPTDSSQRVFRNGAEWVSLLATGDSHARLPPVPCRTNLILNRDAEAPRNRKDFPLHQEFGDAHFSVVGSKDGLGREGVQNFQC